MTCFLCILDREAFLHHQEICSHPSSVDEMPSACVILRSHIIELPIELQVKKQEQEQQQNQNNKNNNKTPLQDYME